MIDKIANILSVHIISLKCIIFMILIYESVFSYLIFILEIVSETNFLRGGVGAESIVYLNVVFHV